MAEKSRPPLSVVIQNPPEKPSKFPWWHPSGAPDFWTLSAHYALNAIEKGTATPEQQRLGLDWFMTEGCGIYQETFIPENAEATANAQGRRSAGLRTLSLMRADPEKIKTAIALQKLRKKSRTE